MEALGSNPMHCLVCNGEVPPERVDLPQELAERLADWNRLSYAFSILWLDSAEYEAFAAGELFRVESVLNQRGLALAEALNRIAPAYFALPDDQSRDEYAPRSVCPLCKGQLIRADSRHDWRVCHACRLVSPGESG
jgi:predicted  nucleic acid-binding Zn ribbon protein